MTNHIILFDGICNYCNGWVNFIIRHDKKNIFRFAPLQSDAGKKLLEQHHLTTSGNETFVYIQNEKAFLKSTAGLKALNDLGGMFSLLYIFIIVPPFIRDFVYDTIARNRYKWWGKKDACMIPTEDIRSRFL